MSDKEALNEVDFSQFWTRFRIGEGEEGETVTPAVFDEEAFGQMFGKPAANAFAQYCSSMGQSITPAERDEMFQNAITTVRQATGVHPQEIRKAMGQARIENLPDR